MGWFNSNKNDKLKWLRIEDDLSYKDAIQSSYEEVILIFKHSIRCSISSMALNRMEDTENKTIDRCYYLDLLSFCHWLIVFSKFQWIGRRIRGYIQ